MRGRRPHVPGTWPLLASIVIVLVLVPAAFLVQVLPPAVAIGVAVAMTAAGLGAFCWSCFEYVAHRRTGNQGIPMAGIAIGAIAAGVSAAALVPLAFG